MLNSISGRNDFYSRYGGVESIYGRNASVQSAGLSSRTLDAINQLSSVDRVSATNLRLSNLNSLNSLSSDFLQKRSGSSTVTLSAPAKIQASLSALNSELKTLASASLRNPLQANLSESSIAGAKVVAGGELAADKKVEVQQLAQGQLSQSGNLSAATALVGEGRLTIQFGAVQSEFQQKEGNAVSVDITAADTLSDVARKIEKAQPNLKASVVSDEAGSRLQLEGARTGALQAFTVQTRTMDGGLATGNLALLELDAKSAQSANRLAQDAKLQIDGRDVSSSSNTISDAGSNLALELRQVGSTSISLARDTDTLSQNFQQFVERVNQARSQLNAIYESGNTGLARKEIARFDEVTSGLSVGQGNERISLNDLGVTTASDGKLIVNETRLSQQVLAKPEAANNLLNLAVDKLTESSSKSLQDASMLNRPFQLIRSNSSLNSNASFLFSGNALSLLQSSTQGASLRGLYGVSQYLLVSQLN